MKRVLAFRRRLGEKIRGGGNVEEVEESPNDEYADESGTSSAGNGGTEGNGDANTSSLYHYAMYEYSQTVQPGQEETFRNRYKAGGPYASYQASQPPPYAPPLVSSPQPCEVNDDALPESAAYNGRTPDLSDSTRTVVHGQVGSPSATAAAPPPREVVSNPPESAAATVPDPSLAAGEALSPQRPEGSSGTTQQAAATTISPATPVPTNLRRRSLPEPISQHKSMSSSFDDYDSHTFSSRKSADAEPEMPDATYEEYYGDAYVGGPIKYIYPSGYQYMRPRSFPWKLSMAVCAVFTWLSIFIVGHCSDRADISRYENNYNQDNAEEGGDDNLSEEDVLEMRWCGSRPLYFMWVLSVSITGLATAYCSIIGYIKVRDFAVANCRSQPPGMVGKSDYYVRIDDTPPDASGHYRKTIYQADGTPQFWGGHIYRPTQAAVAVTSR